MTTQSGGHISHEEPQIREFLGVGEVYLETKRTRGGGKGACCDTSHATPKNNGRGGRDHTQKG